MTIAAPEAPPTRKESFEQEAGPAVGDMPPKAPDTSAIEPEFDPEIVVDGNGQLSFSIGGKPPTVSKLRITGKAVEVRGQFEKGALLEVRATVRVDSIDLSDKRDSQTGDVIDCIRTQKAKIVALSVEG